MKDNYWLIPRITALAKKDLFCRPQVILTLKTNVSFVLYSDIIIPAVYLWVRGYRETLSKHIDSLLVMPLTMQTRDVCMALPTQPVIIVAVYPRARDERADS